MRSLSAVSYLNFAPLSMSSQFWGFSFRRSEPLKRLTSISGSGEGVGWKIWRGVVVVGGRDENGGSVGDGGRVMSGADDGVDTVDCSDKVLASENSGVGGSCMLVGVADEFLGVAGVILAGIPVLFASGCWIALLERSRFWRLVVDSFLMVVLDRVSRVDEEARAESRVRPNHQDEQVRISGVRGKREREDGFGICMCNATWNPEMAVGTATTTQYIL